MNMKLLEWLQKRTKIFFYYTTCWWFLIVWAAFSSNGKANIVFLNDYQNMMEIHLLPFVELIRGTFCVFQWVPAPFHSIESTHGVNVIGLGAKSPGMNKIQKLWVIFVHSVHANDRQFHTKEKLREPIINSCEEITKETRQNLFSTIFRCDLILLMVRVKLLLINFKNSHPLSWIK